MEKQIDKILIRVRAVKIEFYMRGQEIIKFVAARRLIVDCK